MLRVVETSDQSATRRARIGPFLVSLLVHGLFAVILWCIVYSTMKRQLITLTASASESFGEVTLELTAQAESVQPLAVPDKFAPADSMVASEKLIAGSLEANVLLKDLDLEPPSIEFFGTRAYGNRFVFVLDISYSMDARNGRRYQRACDELLRSVSRLKRGQSYYVFLFCWRTEKMFHDPAIKYVEVIPGHQRQLNTWIHGVSLGPGTDPRRALTLARGMNPDALFLLSDGQFNQPSTPQSETGWIDEQGERSQASVQLGVRSFFKKTAIHTVAFENPFTRPVMQDIAEVTGGVCCYVRTETHRPADSSRFLSALRHIDQNYRNRKRPRQEYQTRLSYAREFISDGELVYAEYIVRPLRQADRSLISNEILLTRVLDILASELGDTRLEDFGPAPEINEIVHR
jgi:hypothetical protein